MSQDNRNEVFARLTHIGISPDDAVELRRISMTLHRWHELECGDGNDYASWSIARGRKVNGGFEYDDNGAPYEERHVHTESKARYTRIPDRETGARKRLAKIIAKYPQIKSYVQTDPRGAALYILRQGDVPEGEDVDAYYSRGVAVYK